MSFEDTGKYFEYIAKGLKMNLSSIALIKPGNKAF